jgi:adenosine deaminase
MDVPSLPKALLHDHLDGGLRPQTVIDLAAEVGYDLPSTDPRAIQQWLSQERSGSLDRYLDAFAHIVALMQTDTAITRVAEEAVLDLAADGVRYCEMRFAPSLLTAGGLSHEDVITAATQGLRQGTVESGCLAYLIVVGMRQHTDAAAVAGLAAASNDPLVVGFDMAGPEIGFPAAAYAGACSVAAAGGLAVTYHAGEAAGPEEVRDAIRKCGARRIGHGVHLIEDTRVVDGEIVACGEIATEVLERRIPLELSVTSNVHTGVVPTFADHPIGMLYRAGFNVTVNTDNRLMSGISLSDELSRLVDEHGFSRADLGQVTVNALEAGFGPRDRRSDLVDEIAKAYD